MCPRCPFWKSLKQLRYAVLSERISEKMHENTLTRAKVSPLGNVRSLNREWSQFAVLWNQGNKSHLETKEDRFGIFSSLFSNSIQTKVSTKADDVWVDTRPLFERYLERQISCQLDDRKITQTIVLDGLP